MSDENHGFFGHHERHERPDRPKLPSAAGPWLAGILLVIGVIIGVMSAPAPAPKAIGSAEEQAARADQELELLLRVQHEEVLTQLQAQQEELKKMTAAITSLASRQAAQAAAKLSTETPDSSKGVPPDAVPSRDRPEGVQDAVQSAVQRESRTGRQDPGLFSSAADHDP